MVGQSDPILPTNIESNVESACFELSQNQASTIDNGEAYQDCIKAGKWMVKALGGTEVNPGTFNDTIEGMEVIQ